MNDRKGCLMGAVFLAFLIATAGIAVVPAVARVSGFLCAGRFEVDASSPKNIKHFCLDEQTGERTRINPFLVMLATLAVFAAPLAIPAVFFGSLSDRATRRERAREAAIRAAAAPASATIRAIREGKQTSTPAGRLTRDVELILSLEVADGFRGAYPAEVAWMVHELHFAQAQPGQSVAVRINPAHPERIYPDVEWARLSGAKEG